MPEIALKEIWRVDIIESEAGWGSKIDEIKYFDNKPEAELFIEAYNANLPRGRTPEWYMIAKGPYKVK